MLLQVKVSIFICVSKILDKTNVCEKVRMTDQGSDKTLHKLAELFIDYIDLNHSGFFLDIIPYERIWASNPKP